MQWFIKRFDELSNEELYRILKLRFETFVLEQKCMYLDLDDMDQISMHLFATVDDRLVAYARIQVVDVASSAIIRRVIVHSDFRKNQLGTLLMSKALQYVDSLKDITVIELSAQIHLKKFYESLGFQSVGEPYSDAGIDHIRMLKQLSVHSH